MSAANRYAARSLPEDLILEIFLRLPRKPLARSKCVSKGLLNLMDGQAFKKRYDTYHYSVSDFAVLCIESRHRLYLIDFHLLDDIDSSIEREVSIPLNGNYSRFIDCCKGIVCIDFSPSIFICRERTYTYILFNPFNETFKKVEAYHRSPLNDDFTIGFGYDYATDDYKIVRFQPSVAPFVNKATHIVVLYVRVYSMKQDSWRQVVVEFSPGCPGYTHGVFGIWVDGAIHWLWKENFKVCSSIVAFDLETESMRSIPLPKVEPARTNWILKNFGGRLCVSVRSDFNTTVWVMKEYGVENSWSPLFNIEDKIQFFGYFPTLDNARLLCIERASRSWLWLNTQDGSKKNIQIQKEARFFDSLICVRSPLRLECSH